MIGKSEVPSYVGLMVGLIVGTLICRALGLNNILTLVGGVAVGATFGYLADQWYKRSNAPPPPPPQHPYAGPAVANCPNCGGIATPGTFCPKCGQRVP